MDFLSRAGLAGGPDGVAEFLQRLQAHVGQDRQDVGQGHRRAATIEFETELQRAVVGMAEGAHGDRFADGRVAGLVQAIDFLQVIDRLRGVVALPVARSESFGPAGAHGADLAVVDLGGAECAFEAIDPAAAGLDDLGVQSPRVRRRVSARGHADDIVDAHQGRVRQLRIPGRQTSAPGPGQDAADPLAHPGVVALAWHEGQDRDEPVERVLAGEDLDPGPVEQVQDAQSRRQQLVFRNLEEFVPGIVLQNVLQPLLVVTAGRLSGAVEDLGDLPADQRHL